MADYSFRMMMGALDVDISEIKVVDQVPADAAVSLADGNVVMSVGASGGSTIISSVIQVILNVTVFELDPQEAVARARFHHQWKPDVLFLEPEIGRDIQDALTARGHTVDVRGGYSAVQVVTSGGDVLSGGADPRKGGWPAGVWMSDD
jgi:gamma-glutamyltranspeptidase/glutathione hydrolase